MDTEEVKKYLARYAGLKLKIKRQNELIEEVWSEALIPAMRQGDGSKRQPGGKGRLEAASLRHMEKEEKALQVIAECEAAQQRIEAAIECLSSPQEIDVLFYRYVKGASYRLTKWRVIAKKMYGDDDENCMQAVFRLHGQALVSLGRVLDAHDEFKLDPPEAKEKSHP